MVSSVTTVTDVTSGVKQAGRRWPGERSESNTPGPPTAGNILRVTNVAQCESSTKERTPFMAIPNLRTPDPRRTFTKADRARIHINQDHRCGVAPYDPPAITRQGPAVFGCGERVRNRDGEFHIHHVNPHALNGPTTIDNAIGLCHSCHRRVDHAALNGPGGVPALWPWQAEAVGEAMGLLAGPGQRFTVAAAPGAGKTRFTSAVIAGRARQHDQPGQRPTREHAPSHRRGRWPNPPRRPRRPR